MGLVKFLRTRVPPINGVQGDARMKPDTPERLLLHAGYLRIGLQSFTEIRQCLISVGGSSL